MAEHWGFRAKRDLRLLHKKAAPAFTKTAFFSALADSWNILHPENTKTLDAIKTRCNLLDLHPKISAAGLSNPRRWPDDHLQAFLEAYAAAEKKGNKTAFWYEVHRLYSKNVLHPRPVRSLVTKAAKLNLPPRLLSKERPCSKCGDRVGRNTKSSLCMPCAAKKRLGSL